MKKYYEFSTTKYVFIDSNFIYEKSYVKFSNLNLINSKLCKTKLL